VEVLIIAENQVLLARVRAARGALMTLQTATTLESARKAIPSVRIALAFIEGLETQEFNAL
jgi:hypothetical protein